MGKSSAATKADTAVKLVLVFCISLLSFSVGTYVGKQVSDSEARQASLEVDYNTGDEHASTEAHATEAELATAPISNEEVESLAEEFLKAERDVASAEPAAKEKAAHAEPAKHAEKKTADGYTHHSKIKANGIVEANKQAAKSIEKPKPAPEHKEAAQPTKTKKKPTAKATSTTEPIKAASRVADDKAPTPDPSMKRKPSTTMPSVATTAIGKYTVQVASYATEKEAKSQASHLSGKGYSAFYVPALINKRTWFRVSVGLFSDYKTATNYRTELLETKAVSSAIVQKIVK